METEEKSSTKFTQKVLTSTDFTQISANNKLLDGKPKLEDFA